MAKPARNKTGISNVVIAAVVIVLIVVAGGAYFLVTSSPGPTSSTSSASSSASSTSSATVASSKGVINIGVLVPLSGFQAVDGHQMLLGVDLAASEINAQGGINGMQLKVYSADEAGGSTQLTNAFNQLVLVDNVSYMIGPETSGDLGALIPLINQYHVVTFTPTASLNKLFTNATNYQWTFRLTANDTMTGKGFLYFLTAATHAKSVFSVGDDLVFVHEAASSLANASKAQGISVLGSDFYSTSTTDFSSEVLRIASLKPDAVILFATGSDVITFLTQYKQNPQTATIPIIEVNGTPLEDPAIYAGLLKSNPTLLNYVSVEGEFSTMNVTSKTQPFVKAFSQAFGEGPNLGYAGHTYDAVYAIANAIRQVGTDKQAVVNAIVKSSFVGVTGTISFGSNHELRFASGVYEFPIYQFLPGGKIVIYYPPQMANGAYVPPQ